MTETTPLDQAHAAMQSAPDEATARLSYFERLAESELFLLLSREPEGSRLDPESFDLPDGPVVLAFDREARLTDFLGRAAPYAALSGRVIAAMLAGRGIGLGVNFEVAPSSILIPAKAIDWLHATLAEAPAEIEARPVSLHPPASVPERLLHALDAKLATAAGLAQAAYLVDARYADGTQGTLLGVVDVLPGAQGALARATNEALAFSGIAAGALDIGFFAAADPVTARLAQVGLRFDLPQRESPEARARPGSDPDKPPRLR